MPIPYTIVSKNPGGIAGKREPKYYAALTNRSRIDLHALCDHIAAISTFSKADVMGVVQAFIELIPGYLEEGRNVHVDGFGIFSVHASSKGKKRPDQVSARDITELKMTFLADKKIKQRLKMAKFEKVK